MNDNLHKLRDDYRAVKAPGDLAARVRSQIIEPGHSIFWLPRLATVALLLAVPLALWVDPEPVNENQNSRIPSLSQLMPEKPAASLSFLGSVRSVRLPAMPGRPGAAARNEPVKDSETQMPVPAPTPDTIRKPIQSFYPKQSTTQEAHYEHV